MPTFASLCTGGGAADLGARAAGLKSLWGIEWDDRIANVARANGIHVVTADVCTARPTDFEPPDVLHASPPCPNFSQANTGGKETAEDVSIAQGVARFVDVLRPRAFTLENVGQYAYSESWRTIQAALDAGGYLYTIHGGEHSARLCAADFGGIELCPIHKHVNSAGKSLVRETALDIVDAVATTNGDAARKTHARAVAALLVKAIQQDIAENATWQSCDSQSSTANQIHPGREAAILMNAATSGLESTESTCESIGLWLKRCLADHSLTKKWFTTSTVIRRTTAHLICKSLRATPSTQVTTTRPTINVMDGDPERLGRDCPLCSFRSVPQTRRRFWVRAVRGALLPPLPPPTPWQGWYSAVEDLLPSCPESPLAPWQRERLKDHPVVGSLLVSNNKTEWGDGTRTAGEPAFAVTSQSKGRVRAVLIGSENAGQEWSTGTRDGDQPAMTITTSQKPRTVLIGDQSANAGQGVSIREADEPAMTVRAGGSGGNPPRAITEYRTVQMTLACMARFQTFPDDYAWTDDAQLNARINGNAVPPEQYRRLVAGLVRGW